MRVLLTTASTLAIVLLAVASIASANTAPKPGAQGSCRSCHPTAHPPGWEQGTHADFARRGAREIRGCVLCHYEEYCGYCHGAVPAPVR